MNSENRGGRVCLHGEMLLEFPPAEYFMFILLFAVLKSFARIFIYFLCMNIFEYLSLKHPFSSFKPISLSLSLP